MFHSLLPPYGLPKLKTLLVVLTIASLCWGLALPVQQAAAQSQCRLGCNATVPATAQQNAPVTFKSETTAEGCAVTPAYEWDFGDGSPRDSQQNTSYAYPFPGVYNWRLTSGAARIDTVVGGYGENAPAKLAHFVSPVQVAMDPKGRGFYVTDVTGAGSYLRFVNTTQTEVTIGNWKIAAGAVQRLAGGGIATELNVPARDSELISIVGIATSPDGELVYVLDSGTPALRIYNASSEPKTICGRLVSPGNMTKHVVEGISTAANSLAVNAVNGDIYFIDAAAAGNRVVRISGCESTFVAGSGTLPRPEEPFKPGPALSVPLLQPRALTFDRVGNLYIADAGTSRIIKVDPAGQASLVFQFPLTSRPYPNGLTFVGDTLYAALGNQQVVVRFGGGQPEIVAGQPGRSCDYTMNNCGDGAAARASELGLVESTGTPPLVGLAGDANGLLIPDQGATGRGRIRYLNLSANAATMLGTTIAPGGIDTVAGSGLRSPFDGGLATSAFLSTPNGLAVNADGNLFISHAYDSKLSFVNRGATSVKLFEGTAAEQIVGPGHIVTLNKNVGSGPTDAVPIQQAGFDTPQGLKAVKQGLFIADTKKGPAATGIARRTGLIRFLNTSSENVTFYPNSSTPIVVPPGNIMKIAGGSAFSAGTGDGQFATAARFLGPTDVAIHPVTKDIYVAAAGDQAVRKISGATGIVSTPALPQAIYSGVAFDKEGRLHITDFSNGAVLRETASGSGVFARLNPESQRLMQPRGVVVDADGNAYISETGLRNDLTGAPGSRIARIAPNGQVTTVAGKHEQGFDGDGGAALGARVNLRPDDFNIATLGTAVMLPSLVGLALDAEGNLFFADAKNNRIRRVTSLDANCSQTGRITVSGDNLVPVITSLLPSTVGAGSGAFRLAVIGQNFVPDSKIRWNGADRQTTRISLNRLEAEIPATDLTTAGAVNITVFTPAPGGGASQPQVFTIQPAQNPVPALQAIEPASALARSQGFTLTARGERFTRGSVIRWNTLDMPTTFVSETELKTNVGGEMIARAGNVPISVFTPTPGGGVSARLTFQIKPNSEPKLLALDPRTLPANSLTGRTFQITAGGEAFVQSSTVLWNGAARPTQFVSDKQLTFTISNDEVKQAGNIAVAVSNADSGGAVSGALNLIITAAPEIRLLTPLAVRAGGAGFTLGVSGRNFTPGAEVMIGGKTRRTIFINNTELQVAVEAEDIAVPSLVGVVVLGAANGQLPRGLSNAVNLQVTNAAGGNLANVSAASFAPGPIAPESIVAAFGSGLASATEAATAVPLPTVLRNTRVVVKDSKGAERDAPLFFVSPTQINYLIPAGTANGTVVVTVFSDNKEVAGGIVEIAQVSPAMFTANASGEGLVSGVALRVNASGAPSFEPILRFDSASQKFIATPVDLSVATDQVYLVLFGSGFRNRSALTAVKAQLGGEDLGVSFAGATPGLFGVDQLNLGPLPRTLAGRGTINLVVTVDGKPANTVQLTIK